MPTSEDLHVRLIKDPEVPNMTRLRELKASTSEINGKIEALCREIKTVFKKELKLPN